MWFECESRAVGKFANIEDLLLFDSVGLFVAQSPRSVRTRSVGRSLSTSCLTAISSSNKWAIPCEGSCRKASANAAK